MKSKAAILLLLAPFSVNAAKPVDCEQEFAQINQDSLAEESRPLTSEDGLEFQVAKASFLQKLKKSNEPALNYMNDPSKYKSPNIKIFDNRRLYEPQHMLRFNGTRLIKMYRGLAIEDGNSVKLASEQKGKPIWITPDFEHARLYAAEWTPIKDPKTVKPTVLEMWVPEFMIYWRNDPRTEGMAEAFILDTDVKTLDSFVSKVHSVKKKKVNRPRLDPQWDYWRTDW